jgi:dienelactone hydrolase
VHVIETTPLHYRDAEASLNGLLVRDAAVGRRRPGLLVIHGGAGLDEHARGRARRFADAGFVVVACDVYGDAVAGDRERILRHISDLRADRDALRRRVQPAIDILLSHPEVDGRVAAVGYCFGGMVALELARSGAPLAGVVSVHGSLGTLRPAQPASIDARILVCHGALDPHVPMTQVTAFAEEMTSAGADYQVIVYGSAMHGFTHENATGQQPGVAYHAASDRRSTVAIQAFFDEVLGPAD